MDLNRLAAKIVKESTDPDARDDGKDAEASGREGLDCHGSGDRPVVDGGTRRDRPQRETR